MKRAVLALSVLLASACSPGQDRYEVDGLMLQKQVIQLTQRYEICTIKRGKLSCSHVAPSIFNSTIIDHAPEVADDLLKLRECSILLNERTSIICTGGDWNLAMFAQFINRDGSGNRVISIEGHVPWQEVKLISPIPIRLCDDLHAHLSYLAQLPPYADFQRRAKAFTVRFCPENWRDYLPVTSG
ncbi:MAG TPA: hypothetical protein VGO52_16180 [Hyphomonadaceae bacterium]|jgi:hypothetical protein|nr:hypothetical protein [Hyphomonadaceae bacterium]